MFPSSQSSHSGVLLFLYAKICKSIQEQELSEDMLENSGELGHGNGGVVHKVIVDLISSMNKDKTFFDLPLTSNLLVSANLLKFHWKPPLLWSCLISLKKFSSFLCFNLSPLKGLFEILCRTIL